MKILFVNYEYPPLGGGGGVVMAALARQLALRHEVTVLTSRAFGQPASAIEDGVEVIRVPVLFRRRRATANFASMFAFLFSGLWRGIALMRERRYDVINTHFVLPTGPVGHLLSRFYGLPNVLSVHGGDLYDPSKKMSPHRHAPLRAAVRILIDGADVVVGQSIDTLRRVRDIYGMRRTVELIPLGISPPPAADPAVTRQQFGLPQDAFLMVTVGRLIARKGNARLLRALARCPTPRGHLAIIGSGPEASSLKKLAIDLGIADHVHFLGAVSDADKYQLLHLSDCFVSSSQHEGFGLVFLEAMACRLPVVCFDRGGQTDFLRDGRTGHVIPLNNVPQLAQAMQDLASKPEQRREISQHNRDLAERYFIERCAEQYETVFQAAIDPGFQHNKVLPVVRPVG